MCQPGRRTEEVVQDERYVVQAQADSNQVVRLDMKTIRETPRETERIARLFELVPAHGERALDVGARDGHMSVMLAHRFDRVVALDLNSVPIDHPKVECVQGDAAALDYPDGHFDAVVCAEVLEHIPEPHLSRVCRELARVTGGCLVIGVPYRQDLRVGCTTCGHCGATNPPWGHVNSFDEARLSSLFGGLAAARIDHVGRTRMATNPVSARLLHFAANPYGTYVQDEPCLSCGQTLVMPPARSFAQKVATKLATWGTDLQALVTPERSAWLHVRFEKKASDGSAHLAHSAA
jgi:protein-L-isoaspartate O-methyltransferase